MVEKVSITLNFLCVCGTFSDLLKGHIEVIMEDRKEIKES